MSDAIGSSIGVPSLIVTLCDSATGPSLDTYKNDRVSMLSKKEFSKEAIRVWRAYFVGPGRLILKDSEAPLSDGRPSLVVVQSQPSSFSSVMKRQANATQSRGIHTSEEQVKADEEHPTSGEAFLTWPEEACTQTFLRHSSMMHNTIHN